MQKRVMLLFAGFLGVMLLVACTPVEPATVIEETMAPSDSKPLVIAHRGARSLAPENTLAAARKAYEIGADLWELDVAVTADHELVVMHDDTLERTCNAAQVFPDRATWQVWDFTLEEIQSLDCGSWYNASDPFDQIAAGNVSQADQEAYVGEQAPTLQAALEFTREHDWRVNIELKAQPNADLDAVIIDRVLALIDELGMGDGAQIVISSFNHDYLRTIRARNADIPLQAITSQLIPDLPDYLAELGAQGCNPRWNVWSYARLGELHTEGVSFNVWTVNDELTMQALVNTGVSGIITDYPQTLLALLNE